MSYISLQNLHELEGLFDYIREEAEYQGFKDYIEAEEWTHNRFRKDFPELTSKLSYILRDDIWVDFCPFEKDIDDPEDYNGYAIYISFSRIAMEAIKEVFAEYYI